MVDEGKVIIRKSLKKEKSEWLSLEDHKKGGNREQRIL